MMWQLSCIGDCRPGHARAVKLHACSACCMLCSYRLRLECSFLSEQGVNSLPHLYITWLLGLVDLEQSIAIDMYKITFSTDKKLGLGSNQVGECCDGFTI